MPKEWFLEEEECKKDYRTPIKGALLREEDVTKLKNVKDYILMKGELYCSMPRGILSRCVGCGEAQRNLEEVHSKTYGIYREVSLYRRL